MPWAFIPFLLLLSVRVAPVPEISWNVQSLLIPVSAWIGHRYGPAGVRAVFYASIPLILFQFSVEDISFGANGGLIFAALAFAWLMSSTKNHVALASYLVNNRRHLWWLLILPLNYYLRDNDNFRFTLNSSLSVNAAFFIIGLVYPRQNFRQLWKVVAGMFLIGVGIILALIEVGMEGRLNTEFGKFAYTFFAPQDVVSVVIFLFAGDWCRRYLENGTLPRGPFSLSTPTLLIAIMIFSYLRFGLRFGFGLSLDFTGDVYVSILCCFLAGLFYRKRGILIVLAPAFILTLLYPAFLEIRRFGGDLLPDDVTFYIWTRSPVRAAKILVEFFLWTCAGAQLRAFIRDEPSAAPVPGTPAQVGGS